MFIIFYCHLIIVALIICYFALFTALLVNRMLISQYISFIAIIPHL